MSDGACCQENSGWLTRSRARLTYTRLCDDAVAVLVEVGKDLAKVLLGDVSRRSRHADDTLCGGALSSRYKLSLIQAGPSIKRLVGKFNDWVGY